VPRDRADLIRDAAIEAARSVMAHVLLRERRVGILADVTADEVEALQTMRDALAAEPR
jgi:hypothetical protein